MLGGPPLFRAVHCHPPPGRPGRRHGVEAQEPGRQGGEEGGFEQVEREFIKVQSKSFENICLGSNILKADTAVIAALSLTFHYFS